MSDLFEGTAAVVAKEDYSARDIEVLEVSKEELFEMMKSEAIIEADMLQGLWKYFTKNIVIPL